MVLLRHIPSLFLATTFTFGGLWPLWSKEACQAAMRDFGLPPHVRDSSPAQSVMVVYSSRMTVMGLALYLFHYRKMYAAVDVILLCLGWAGAVDGYICWKEGAPNTALFRFCAGIAVATLGAFNVTAGS